MAFILQNNANVGNTAVAIHNTSTQTSCHYIGRDLWCISFFHSSGEITCAAAEAENMDSALALLLLSSNATRNQNETFSRPHMVNNSFVMEILHSIHIIYGFKNFVFYISERLAYDTETSNDFFRDFWQYFPLVPVLLMVDNSISMDGFLSTPTLCLVMTTGYDDPIMKISKRGLRGVRFLKTIFIYFPIVESEERIQNYQDFFNFYDSIQNMYAWIWAKQFFNSMLVTVWDNVFILEPYPTRQIVNVTSNWTGKTFFVDYSRDFKGYVINTPVRYDLPRVFFMKGPRYGLGKKVPRISGVSGKLFMAFIEYIGASINASLIHDHEYDPVDMGYIIKQIESNQLEISMNSITGLLGTTVGNSYPIGINDWCIMVPYRDENPAHMYMVNIFHGNTWSLIGFTIIYLTLGIWLCSPSHKRDLTMAFLQALCSLLALPPLRVVTTRHLRSYVVFFLLFVMGFLTTNLYVTKMASFLTATPKVEQINTVEDVIQAKLHVFITDYEYDLMVAKGFPQDFMELMIPVTKGEMDSHRDKLNTTYGYSIQSDRWDFLNIQQRFMVKPLFRLSNICMGPFYHIFLMQRDSHLASPLQTFLMFSYQYGFMSYWNNEAFADALFLGYVRIILEETSVAPLGLQFFRVVWMIWWFGITLSGLILCAEIKEWSWQRFKASCKRFFRVHREIDLVEPVTL
ncbi:uncharacterized protein LOC142239636 [Haematobia irritans]|uniref:uncharacterized protein LOC142239636 n=1 Tax=Haematobia irritans TaxID=7368 RepID=UPI003F4F5965